MPPPIFDDIDLHVDSVIKDWADKNTDKIIRAYTQKGGWEGWAQVEIAIALHQSCKSSDYKNPVDAHKAGRTKTSREVRVYPNPQLADIVIESGAPRQRKFVIIELKCEGSYNDGTFVKRVEEDIRETQGGYLERIQAGQGVGAAVQHQPKGVRQDAREMAEG